MIVKAAKAVARLAGKAVDEEDRRVLGEGVVYLLALCAGALAISATVSLAIRVFEAIQGA